jgi:mevalonate kinase
MAQATVATAPGKIILFGEHAVVYGEPAIAVPLKQLRATVSVEAALPGSGLTLVAADLDRVIPLETATENDPLAAMARLTLEHLDANAPDATLTIRSNIPMASGLGSGTSVSTAIVRALASHLGYQLPNEVVSQLVYAVEKLYHGTPSGVDNTVIAFEMPVYFTKGQAIETFEIAGELVFLIGDSGVASSTRVAVGDVRRGWQNEPDRYERVFRSIGALVREARSLVEIGGSLDLLGELMDLNHRLLRELAVSNALLDGLVSAARAAGALGAKLSGAGRGGNMIALVKPQDTEMVSHALRTAGAVRVIRTQL